MPVIPTLLLALPFAAAASADATTLEWISGCWAAESGEPGSGETWSSPRGGTLLATSRSVRGGRTVAHEFVIVRPRADGVLEYVAHPSGQSPAAFALVEAGEHQVVFENPAHDFPQRIEYRRDGERLLASIHGPSGAGTRTIEFPMRRTDCPL
ncbi:MAG TPA: DUF6265 family protein [Xanthomonadaceae bacterium]|nr:DUF6265 family protein [Xanthomonadaceae bacterium]